MNIIPYMNFDGNCEQALKRYVEIFNGEIVYLQRYKDAPDMGISGENLELILYAQLKINDQLLYCSDIFPGTPSTKESRIYLNLTMTELDEAIRIFDALSLNGDITSAFEKQFWGDTFGSLIDEFGIPWSMNCNEEK